MRTGIFCGTSLRRLKNLLLHALAFAFWLMAGQAAYAQTVTVNPPIVQDATVPVGSYSQQFTASDTPGGPFTFQFSGTMPTGLSWDPSTATLSGSLNTAGCYPYTITATDTNTTVSGSTNYSFCVATNSLTITPGTAPAGVVGTPYNTSISGFQELYLHDHSDRWCR